MCELAKTAGLVEFQWKPALPARRPIRVKIAPGCFLITGERRERQLRVAETEAFRLEFEPPVPADGGTFNRNALTFTATAVRGANRVIRSDVRTWLSARSAAIAASGNSTANPFKVPAERVRMGKRPAHGG
jgi:hypothetical protein